MSCVFLFLSFYMRALRNSWAGYLAHWEIPCRSVGRSGKIFAGRAFGQIIKISFRSGRYIVGLSNCRNLSFGNLSSGYLHMPRLDWLAGGGEKRRSVNLRRLWKFPVHNGVVLVRHRATRHSLWRLEQKPNRQRERRMNGRKWLSDLWMGLLTLEDFFLNSAF